MRPNRFSLIILLIGSINLSPAQALDFNLYQAGISYSENNSREQGSSSGLYLAGSADNGLGLESVLEQTLIDYRSGLQTEQFDTTLVARYLSDNKFSLRLGRHQTESDNDIESDGKQTLITEYLSYTENIYGAAFYQTQYQHIDATVQQLSATLGRYSWLGNISGTFYSELKAHHIQLNDNGDESDYQSLSAKLLWYNNEIQLELGGWLGERRSFVDNGGYTVYNLSDLYQGGVNISGQVKFGKRGKLRLSAHRNRLIESGAAQSDSDVLVMSLGLSL